jgi:tellurite resistance protein TerC
MFDTIHLELWVAFATIVTILLVLDLAVVNRSGRQIRMRAALVWSSIWIGVALLFNAGIYYFLNGKTALEFLTAYLIEESLSVDNLFVFLILFRYFGIPRHLQHRVLFWGVIGAIVLRIVMIVAGVTLVKEFHWLLYVFGAFLIVTGVKLALARPESSDPSRNLAVRLARRLLPLSDRLDGEKFWVRKDGRLHTTPLLVALITIEFSDVMFALDSIPAVFGISEDAFVIITSNIFAVLGLRSLYFVIASFMDKFKFLNFGLAVVLTFIGCKMLLDPWVQISTALSLGVVGGILVVAVGLSIWSDYRMHRKSTRSPRA